MVLGRYAAPTYGFVADYLRHIFISIHMLFLFVGAQCW
jgi:hypothetical protein